MSDNLTNEIKKSLFESGSVTVNTTDGDITPVLLDIAQSGGQEKYNLDQRDDLTILVYSLVGTVVAGATLTVKYYNRVPNAMTDAVLLATETKTLAEITVGNYLATEFTSTALELADYFTVETTLKQAVGSNYTVTANVIVKKKIVDEPLVNQETPVSETKASLTIQTALKLESKLLGTLGNYITVKAISSGVAGMSISNLTGAGTQASPYLIEIKLGTTTTNNTMTLIAAAIVAKTDVAAIVNTITITGATQMTVFTAVPLVGGLNGSAGYLGEVRFNTDGTRWELNYISGDCYYWSPDGFPAVNQKYIDYFNGSKIVWKKKITTTSPNALTATGYSIGESFLPIFIETPTGWLEFSSAEWSYFPALIFNGASRGGLHTNVLSNLSNITIQLALASFQSKPMTIFVKFTEA